HFQHYQGASSGQVGRQVPCDVVSDALRQVRQEVALLLSPSFALRELKENLRPFVFHEIRSYRTEEFFSFVSRAGFQEGSKENRIVKTREEFHPIGHRNHERGAKVCAQLRE